MKEDSCQEKETERVAPAHNLTLSCVTQAIGHVTHVSRSDFVRLLYVTESTVVLTSEPDGLLSVHIINIIIFILII